MSAEVDATLLVESVAGVDLPPGIYAARAQDPAYGGLEALVAEKRATYLGEKHEPDGTKLIAVAVPGSHDGATLAPNMGGAIRIGREFFTTALRDYHDWQEKWWREGVQNGVDAGATRIECLVEEVPEGFAVSITDDGRGMDEDTLLNKFLVLGGTTKIAGDTRGGFGKAKELLVLPWLAWSIHTRDRKVVGAGLDYQVEPAPYIRGTTLRVVMPPDQTTHASAAIAFISKCNLPDVRFTVNGERHKAKLEPGEEIRDFVGKAKLYYDKKGKIHGLYVRTMGLFMFEQWVSDAVKGTLVVELTGSSVELLTANRDGIRDYELKRGIEKYVNELAADVSSALKKKKGLIREKFQGAGKFSGASERDLRAAMLDHLEELQPAGKTKRGLILSEGQAEVLTSILQERGGGEGSALVPDEDPGKLNMRVSGEMASAMLDATVMAGPSAVEAAIRQLAWEPDFYLINEVEGFRVPKMFYPEGMTPGVKKLARAWAELCRFVLIQLGCAAPFGVGFIFGHDVGAAYQQEGEENWLLLNPFRDAGAIGRDKPSKEALYGLVDENDVNWVYAAAIHECTHMADGVHYHDESFSSAFTRNVSKTANKDRQVKAIIKAIKARGPKAPGAAPREKKAPAFPPLADVALEKARVGNAWKGGAEYVLFTYDNTHPYEHSSSEAVLKGMVVDYDLRDAEIRKAGGKVVWRREDFRQPLAEVTARGKKGAAFPPLADAHMEQERRQVTLASGYRYSMFAGNMGYRVDVTDDLTGEALARGRGVTDVEWRDKEMDGAVVWRSKDFSQPLAGADGAAASEEYLPPLADTYDEENRQEAAREHGHMGNTYVSFKEYSSSVWDYSRSMGELIKRSQADITNDEIYFEIRETATGLPVWRSENFGLRVAKSHAANRPFQGMHASAADMEPEPEEDEDDGEVQEQHSWTPNAGGDAPYRITLHQAGDPREDVLCDTLDEASAILSAYQSERGMGASDMGRSHGLVTDRATGQPVAKVSYNGRIWPVESDGKWTPNAARRKPPAERSQHFAGYDFTSGPSGTRVHREAVDTQRAGDYGADPLGDGMFRMVPSGDVVDFAERSRRLARH